MTLFSRKLPRIIIVAADDLGVLGLECGMEQDLNGVNA